MGRSLSGGEEWAGTGLPVKVHDAARLNCGALLVQPLAKAVPPGYTCRLTSRNQNETSIRKSVSALLDAPVRGPEGSKLVKLLVSN